MEKKDKPKRKRKRSTNSKSILHTYPVKYKRNIIKGDIVEIDRGVFIDVCRIYPEDPSFDGVELLDLSKVRGYSKEEKKNNLVNKCIDIYKDSSKKEKSGAIELIEYLKHLMFE